MKSEKIIYMEFTVQVNNELSDVCVQNKSFL